MSAGIYAARFKLDTLIIARNVGGLIVSAHLIENWPGEIKTSGLALMKKLEEHVKSLGVTIINDEVLIAKKADKGFILKTKSGKDYKCRALLLATGTERRKLDVKGAKEYDGRGISYCAACDGPLFRNKVVGVVGGSDSAAKEALLVSEYAKKVFIIYRGEEVRAEPINAELIRKNKKIEVITKTNVVEVKGNGLMNKVLLDKPYKGSNELLLDGLFVEIGMVPETGLAKSLGCKLNDKGEIIIDREARTSEKLVYAAGDCTDSKFKQAITGAALGVIAMSSAYEDLRK